MRQLALSVLGLAMLAPATFTQSTPLLGELMWSGYSRPVQISPAPGLSALREQSNAKIRP